MKQKNISKSIAKIAIGVLNTVLCVDANSTSCMVIYQPKAPKELERFRRYK